MTFKTFFDDFDGLRLGLLFFCVVILTFLYVHQLNVSKSLSVELYDLGNSCRLDFIDRYFMGWYDCESGCRVMANQIKNESICNNTRLDEVYTFWLGSTAVSSDDSLNGSLEVSW